MLGKNRAIFGRYKGELLDDSTRHSIVLRQQQSLPPEDRVADDLLIADYFYHEGQFWAASIPIGGVEEIRGQAFNFSRVQTRAGKNGPETVYDPDGVPKRRAPLNHLQSRFVMGQGQTVDLYPLGGAIEGEPVHRIDDFVYSIEAVGPPGVGFGLWDGLNGSLISAHRFLSTQEMVFERIVVENQYVIESAPLPLSAEQRQKLLLASLDRSDRAGMTERYYLYRCCGTNNCTSSPFELLDRAVDYNWPQRLGAKMYRLPLNPRAYLRVRGMDADPAHRKLVRKEFADYINAPQTQKRKRVYVKTKIRALRDARASRNGDHSQRLT